MKAGVTLPFLFPFHEVVAEKQFSAYIVLRPKEVKKKCEKKNSFFRHLKCCIF
ncbi:hypothetical protein AWRI1631_152120 [Saccharomyces cerevisiae AWRI1631]|uniref:Uncharacterized protein n=1 Tax=Saccharomyces cerevisiae (strain AWRI1631) TaxID=545124 RepID=B5VRV0_YEAS6|nr:hypothetical protein AWRI1631_152120 [Saccharomyces cerevisiae AWRI1631]